MSHKNKQKIEPKAEAKVEGKVDGKAEAKEIAKPFKIEKIKAVFDGENVSSNKEEAMTLHAQSRFGEFKSGKVIYSMFESLYLLEKEKMEVSFKKKKLKFEQLLEIGRETDKTIRTKYIVFRDMRNRGFIVKTALKFGADFRVYDRGVKPGEDHARWILYPVFETSSLTWHDFSAKNRVAHSTKKNLLIGVVDEETDVTYYEIKWTKP